MIKLNFPKYTFRFKNKENKLYIFDSIRKKYILNTPEEWVRQHVVLFLLNEMHYPESFINVEKKITINGLTKRYDVVVFSPDGSIFLLVECKAPNIQINQTTFDQIARYNMTLQANYLMVTNGINHYFCQINSQEMIYHFLKELPPLNLNN